MRGANIQCPENVAIPKLSSNVLIAKFGLYIELFIFIRDTTSTN